MKNRNKLVYDLPMRIFHWLFAGYFIFAFTIAKTADSESITFSYHMLAGITVGFLVILRLIWGVIGSKHSRFKSFPLQPKELFTYLSDVRSGKEKLWSGHNPASSWAAIIMMLFALSLVGTGILMGTGFKEDFEDIHEIFAYGFLITALSHIAGVVIHSLRHKDNIALSMIDGKKLQAQEGDVIPHSNRMAGLLFLGAVFLFVIFLAKNFDTNRKILNVFGTQIELGEKENDHAPDGAEHESSPDDDSDED